MFKKLLIPNQENNYTPYIIRKSALAIYTLALFLFNLLSPMLLPESSQVVASTISVENIVALANKERTSAGLNSLNTDVRLNAAALAKANDMFAKDYWDHFGPNGETPWQFISNAGYTYVYAGENLAKGFVTAEGVHQAWMSSPTHKANIMNGNYRDIGVAVAEGTLLGEQVILVVQMFGSTVAQKPVVETPPEVLPSEDSLDVDNDVDEVINVEQGEIKSISIVRPAEGDIIKDPAFDVEGTVEGYESNIGEYSVTINRNGLDIATSSSSSEEWSVDKQSDWEEGEHKISVFIDGFDNISDSVNFTVDSTPPTFYADSLSMDMVDNHAEISIYVEEEDATVMLNLGSETYGFAHEGAGIFTAYVPRASIETSDMTANLLVSDKNGNSTSMDVTQRLATIAEGNNLQTVSNPTFVQKFFAGVTTMDLKAKVNLGFALFLLIILIIQVILYKKSGMLHDKGGYLLTIGIFLFLVVVGTLTEVTGSIN